MPKWALIFGALLVTVGLVGYLGADAPAGSAADAVTTTGAEGAVSPASAKTALIPALVGMALVLCGTIGLMPDARKHAMHVAAGVALLGFLAAAGRIGMTIGKLMQGDISRASYFLIGMALLCGAYVFLSVQSFRNARRERERAQAGS
jgi:hypothetical protein